MHLKHLQLLGAAVLSCGLAVGATAAVPENIYNIVMTCTLTGATGTKNDSGTFSELYTSAGTDYTYASVGGVLSDPTPYTYQVNNATTSTIMEPDVTVVLTHNTSLNGTFVATYADGDTQQGTFELSALSFATPLLNISTRTNIGAGRAAIAGFVVGTGTGPRRVLVRGIGPALADYDVDDVLPDPKLTVYRGSSVIAADDDWDENAASTPVVEQVTAATGAFPLESGSKDAAILLTLDPGVYTAVVEGVASTDAGEALIEVYFVD